MAAVPDVRFAPPIDVARVVAVGGELLEIRGGRGAVVAREDHQRALGKAVAIERAQHLAERPVGLHDEVGVGVDAALPPPLR